MPVDEECRVLAAAALGAASGAIANAPLRATLQSPSVRVLSL